MTSIEITIGVVWRCLRCGEERTVQCPARDPKLIDVVTWVDQVGALCGANHVHVSPNCGSIYLDLKIPHAKDAEYVGAPRPH